MRKVELRIAGHPARIRTLLAAALLAGLAGLIGAGLAAHPAAPAGHPLATEGTIISPELTLPVQPPGRRPAGARPGAGG
jgi:hypothetical protein